jgi:hypothetical protein
MQALGVLISLPIFAGSMISLGKIRAREIRRRREERLIAWIKRDLPPIPD